MTTGLPPPPNTQVLSLVAALSQTENHDLHIQAIRAKDEALSSSPATYGNLCLQLAFLLVGSNRPETMLQQMEPSELEAWRQANMTTALRLKADPAMWIPFGQMGGLILKNALLRPPVQQTGKALAIDAEIGNHLKETLLYGLSLDQSALQNVISTISGGLCSWACLFVKRMKMRRHFQRRWATTLQPCIERFISTSMRR